MKLETKEDIMKACVVRYKSEIICFIAEANVILNNDYNLEDYQEHAKRFSDANPRQGQPNIWRTPVKDTLEFILEEGVFSSNHTFKDLMNMSVHIASEAQSSIFRSPYKICKEWHLKGVEELNIKGLEEIKENGWKDFIADFKDLKNVEYSPLDLRMMIRNSNIVKKPSTDISEQIGGIDKQNNIEGNSHDR